MNKGKEDDGLVQVRVAAKRGTSRLGKMARATPTKKIVFAALISSLLFILPSSSILSAPFHPPQSVRRDGCMFLSPKSTSVCDL
jgi:hypothetical protein